MKAPYTYSRSRKPIAKAAIAGFVFAPLFCILHGVTTEGCHLFHNMAWVALEVLGPAISAAWRSVPTHLCDASKFLQLLLQIVTSIRPLLCVIAG